MLLIFWLWLWRYECGDQGGLTMCVGDFLFVVWLCSWRVLNCCRRETLFNSEQVTSQVCGIKFKGSVDFLDDLRKYGIPLGQCLFKWKAFLTPCGSHWRDHDLWSKL